MDERASTPAAARGDRGESAASAQVGRAGRGGYPTARRVAALLWGLCLVIALATLVLLAIGPGRVPPSDIFSGVGGVSFLILAMTFASVGALVARRAPENRIGWIFLLTGLANSVQLLSWQYADVGLHATDLLPGATAAAVFNSVTGEATAGLLGLSLLLFPDGRLPSRRWRPALASLLVGMALLRAGRDAAPRAVRRAVRAGVEPVRPRGCGWSRGRGRLRRLVVRDRPGSRSELRRWSSACGERAASSVSSSSSCSRSALWRRLWPPSSWRPGSSGRRDICRRGSRWSACASRAFRSSPASPSSATACTRSTSSSIARSSTSRSPSSWPRRSQRRSCCSGRCSGAAQGGRPRRRRSSSRSPFARCARGYRTRSIAASTVPVTTRCGGLPSSSRTCAPDGRPPRGWRASFGRCCRTRGWSSSSSCQ